MRRRKRQLEAPTKPPKLATKRLLQSAAVAFAAGMIAVLLLVGCWIGWTYLQARSQKASGFAVATGSLDSIAAQITFVLVFVVAFLLWFGRLARNDKQNSDEK